MSKNVEENNPTPDNNVKENSTQNETQCQECEREIICLAYFYHEAEQIGMEVHCVGRTIPLVISKKYLL